jgi:hypothetical protein
VIEGPAPSTWWVDPGRLLVGPYPVDHLVALREAAIDVVFDLTHESDKLRPYAPLLDPGVRVVRRWYVGPCETSPPPQAVR